MPGRLRGRILRRDTNPDLHPQRDGFQKAEGEEQAIPTPEELLARTHAGADAQASALDKADGGTRARAIVQLQSEHGNAYVQRLVSKLIDTSGASSHHPRGAAPKVQRDSNAAPANGSLRPDVRTYVSQWALLIRQDLAKQMAQVELASPGPFVMWEDLSGQKFIEAAMRPIMSAAADLWSTLVETLAPISPEAAVNRGRDADEDGTGANVYNRGVAQELRILFTRQLNASLSRIIPRYLAAKEQTITAEYAHSALDASPAVSGNASPASTVLDPNTRQTFGLAPAPAPHEPSPGDIAPSHPMDKHVITALVSGVAVADIDAYRKRTQANTAALPKRPRTVDFDFEAIKGTLAWLRVKSPVDATAEDVAKTLYGDAALAYTVIAAPPLFAVNQQKVSHEHAQKLRALPRTDFTSGDPTGTLEPPDLTQAGPQYDQAAVNQARDLPLTTLDKDEIVQRMRMTLMHLDAMAPSAKTFGLDKRLLPVRAKIDARSKALQASTNPRDMLQWDAQSAEQSDLVIKAERGLRIAAEQYAAMTAPSETGRVESLPGYVERPLRSIAEAYIDAASTSDLVATAGTRLADADEKSTTYPVDVLEGALGSLRSVLMGAKTEEGKSGLGGDAAYDVSALQARESVLRTRLVNVRETLVANPTQAAKELKLIQAEVDDLQTEVSMVGYLDELAVLMGEVEKNLPHRDVLPDSKTDKAWQDLMLRLVQWHNRLDNIRREYRGGDKAKARQALKVFLADGHFAGALQLVASDIVYREKVEQIDKLLSKLAVMVGVAIATMGVGLLVEGGMVGLGFSAAGFGSAAALGTTLVVSAAEAMSFTILSRQILESDSEHGSFILDFLMNWGLFTIMRSVGAGYKAFIGEEAAGTLIGKAGGLLVEFTSITATTLGIEYAKKKAAGQELTKAEARDIVLQSAAMFIGTAVGARLGEPLLKGIKLRGLKFGARVKTLNLERAQLRLKAEALEKSGNIKQAPDVLAKDANLLEQEQVLIKDVVRAALDPNAPSDEQLGPQELAELGELRKENKATLEGNARTRLMLRLEPRGGNTFLAPKGELNSKGGIADEYRALGDEVTSGATDEVTHSESVSVKPSDGADPITIVEKAGAADTAIGAADAGSAAAHPASGGCFVAGTVVVTENGERAIETLTAGDVVLAADPQTGAQVFQRITHTWVHHERAVLDIQVGGTILTCTPAHPFWVTGLGWREAGTLQPGMGLRTRSGETPAVLSVDERAGQQTVFNLEVEGLQTYFVGEPAVLVHNKAWELLPSLRPAMRRAGNLRERLRTTSDAHSKAPNALAENARQIAETLAKIEQRSNRANSLRDIENLTNDVEAAEAELTALERLQGRAALLLKQARAIAKQAHTLADSTGGSEHAALVNAANRCEQIAQSTASGALDIDSAEGYEAELTRHAQELHLIDPGDVLFSKRALDEYLAEQFSRDEKSRSGKIKTIDKSRMPEDMLDIEGTKKPGTNEPEVPGQILKRGTARRAKTVLGKRVNSEPAVEQAWQRARDRVLARKTLDAENYEDVYNDVRDRFWIEVFDDAAARAFFESSGFVFTARGKAPVLGAAMNQGIAVEEYRISLDHIEPKAKEGNWVYALDADKLEYRTHADNTMLQHIETRHKELGR